MITMKNPAVFGVYGKSDTGKTKLIERLIKKLTIDRYKVATIKKTDKKISMDKKGKDTWKHSSSGSILVVLSSPIETDIIIKDKIPTLDIIQNISEFGCYDVILIEGAREPTIQKIRLGNIKERDNTIFTYKDNFEDLYGLVKKEIDKKIKFNYNIAIWVNSKAIPLTEFPADIIKNSINGMIKSLKGIDKINDVKIHFKN